MNETAPLQKQDLDRVVTLLQAVLAVLWSIDATLQAAAVRERGDQVV